MIPLLLAAGPSLLRMVGGMFGGKTAEVANGVANVVDEVKGLSPAAAQAELEQHLKTLSPEQIAALEAVKIQLAKIEQEREAARLAAETTQISQAQETARVEVQSGDEYVRRTRPKLARQSAYVAFLYAFCTALVFPLIRFVVSVAMPDADVPELPSVQEWIIIALFTPCAAYMGFRTADGFSRAGKT